MKVANSFVTYSLYQATPVLLAIELDKLHRDDQGNIVPMFKVIFREEIPRTQFTMDSAIQRIIKLNDMYDFDWIAADRGYGDTQIEMLRKYGTEHPQTRLHEKVVGYQLGQKIEVRDPHTWKKEKKHLKPFMVNNSVRIFERNKIILNPGDKVLQRQLENYRVKSISSNGIPTYVDVDEHSVDALNLALVCFEQNYGDLMKMVISTKILGLPVTDPFVGLVPSRTDGISQATPALNIVKIGNTEGRIVDVAGYKKKPRPQMFSRSFTR